MKLNDMVIATNKRSKIALKGKIIGSFYGEEESPKSYFKKGKHYYRLKVLSVENNKRKYDANTVWIDHKHWRIVLNGH